MQFHPYFHVTLNEDFFAGASVNNELIETGQTNYQSAVRFFLLLERKIIYQLTCFWNLFQWIKLHF